MGPRYELSETHTFVDIQILVVDDDATSLAVVSAMLRICRYRVVTVKNPLEALNILRARIGIFDLLVTDLHMPQMDGLQLQKKVKEEFNLPVIMISADEKPETILKSLKEGVALYMVKPISLDDLKHVWQYAITANAIKKTSLKETSSTELKSTKSKNKRAVKKTNENGVNKNSSIIRKQKVVWTNSLHNRFLQAIKQIGLDKAVPKRILEFMNVPDLTRENVASHLQKYRIFLKRVAEKGACSLKGLPQCRLLQSNFVSSNFLPPIYKENFPFSSENHQMSQSSNYQPILRENISDFSFQSHDLAAKKNPFVHMGNGQQNLLNNEANLAFNYNGMRTSAGEGHLVSFNNGGLSFNGGSAVGNGSFSGQFDGTDQLLRMISDSNLQGNGSILLPFGEERAETWEETNKTNTFEDVEENLGDINLSEILMEKNHSQVSLQKKEEMVGREEMSEMWNLIELDDSPKELEQQTLPQPQPQDWDDEVLEFLFGDNSS